LDSLGFVNFIALVEEKCAHKYGIAISLTETSSQEDGALEDVGKFADSLFQRLNKTSSVEPERNVLKRGSDSALQQITIEMKGLLLGPLNCHVRSSVGRNDKHGAVPALTAAAEAASAPQAGSFEMIGRRAGLVDHATSCILVSWRLWRVWQLMDFVD
jgi:hypothetical protein